MSATALLRPGLLQGASLLLAGPPSPLAAAVRETFGELGARVSSCLPDGEDEPSIDAAVAAACAELGAIDVLVVDGAGLFSEGLAAEVAADASGDAGSAPQALRACLDSVWNVTRAVVNQAFLPTQRAGRIVYLAPAPDAGESALAARAGLENLARTLSVEWARHQVNVVTIAPGPATGTPTATADDAAAAAAAAAEIAALTAYLASSAGAYFSGCLLDLGATRARPMDLGPARPAAR